MLIRFVPIHDITIMCRIDPPIHRAMHRARERKARRHTGAKTSTIGLAIKPGTAVDPKCSISPASQAANNIIRRARCSANRSVHTGSQTTRPERDRLKFNQLQT